MKVEDLLCGLLGSYLVRRLKTRDDPKVKKALKSVFLRVYSPKATDAGGDVNPSLEPNVPTSKYTPLKLGDEPQDSWSYSVKDMEIKNAPKVPCLPEFNKQLPTMIYIHGFKECCDSQSVRTVVQAYMTRADYNVIVVDWRNIAQSNLIGAALTTSALGGELAEAVDGMVKCGLPLDGVHLVAHSMGAHVASFLCKYTKGAIPRFTALDPSGVGLNWIGIDGLRLCPDDACFVDVIHTDGGRYGINYSVGHADFYPNNGRRIQPGCPTSFSITSPFSADAMASHWRSWQFFAESVLCGRDQFLSKGACSWAEFKENNPSCDCSPMGFYADCAARGDYFCQTNAKPPFGRGITGTRYDPSLDNVKDNKAKSEKKPVPKVESKDSKACAPRPAEILNIKEAKEVEKKGACSEPKSKNKGANKVKFGKAPDRSVNAKKGDKSKRAAAKKKKRGKKPDIACSV